MEMLGLNVTFRDLVMVNLGSSWFPGTFYFLFFHLGQFGWKMWTCISITRGADGVKCLKSLGTNSRIGSVWKLGGNPLGHLVEMPCWQMWRLAQNVGDSSRWKNSPEQKIPAFWLRPEITLLVVKSLCPGTFSDPVCGFASVGEKQQGQEMLISWWSPGIQAPQGGQHFCSCFWEGECKGQTWKSGLRVGCLWVMK